MIITSARSSFFNNFDVCQTQCFITYCLGHKLKNNKKAELGSALHLVMEVLALLKKTQQENLPSFEHDKFGHIETISKEELFNPSYVNIWIRKSYEYYKEHADNLFTEDDFSQIKAWTYKALEYNNGTFDPRTRDIIEVEHFFDLPIEEPWGKYSYEEFGLIGNLRILGTMDLITKVSDSIYEVTDYKSGKFYDWINSRDKTQEDLQHDIQPRMYHYVLYKLYPHIKQFVLTFFYVNSAGPVTIVFDQNDRKHTENLIHEKFELIKKTRHPKMKSREQKHFFCQRVCDAFKQGSPDPNKNYCKYISDKISSVGINQTIIEEKNPNWTFGNYVQN